MDVTRNCSVNALTAAIRYSACVPLLVMAPLAWGETVDAAHRVIDGTTAAVPWEVLNKGSLTANGATTDRIDIKTGSSLVLQGSTVVAGSASPGIVVQEDSQASISNSIISSGNFGVLSVSGSDVQITGSTVTSGTQALVVTGATMRVSSTNATGDSAGMLVSSGQVEVASSQLTGGIWGIALMQDATNTTPTRITLEGTQVTGGTGAAIYADDFGSGREMVATIDVNNGSTLSGGDGRIVDARGAATTLTVNLNGGTLEGDVHTETGSTLNLNLAGAALSGAAQATDGSTLAMRLAGSQFTGDLSADDSSSASLELTQGSQFTGRLVNVGTVAINSGAQWNMLEDSTLGDLSMDGGAVQFGAADQYLTLNLASLTGSGVFKMDVDFASGQHDFLNVTGDATGSHELLVASTGVDPAGDASLHLVHIDGGDAEFSLAGGEVDRGTWSYGLAKQGENDWYLDATQKVISPSTEAVLALFNTAPTVWYGELATLRSRMGELRLNGAKSGAWMRAYGSKYNVSAANGLGYSQNQHGLSLGADAPLPVGDGQWLIGVLAGHSDSDLSLRRGTSGTVKSYYAGVYATWLDADSGYYFDGVLKANRFRNDSKVNMSDGTRSKGDYDNSALGSSLEFGRHIPLNDGYFIEPYTQWSAVVIQGKDYDLDNGMHAEGDRTRSLLGKAGATLGRTFDLGEGGYAQPYAKAAYVHEFAKNNEVQVNDNLFNNDLSGSRGEVGAGLAVSVNETWQVHADFDYSHGDNIEQPWGASLGVRYSW